MELDDSDDSAVQDERKARLLQRFSRNPQLNGQKRRKIAPDSEASGRRRSLRLRNPRFTIQSSSDSSSDALTSDSDAEFVPSDEASADNVKKKTERQPWKKPEGPRHSWKVGKI